MHPTQNPTPPPTPVQLPLLSLSLTPPPPCLALGHPPPAPTPRTSAFDSAFADHTTETMWLFGTNDDRDRRGNHVGRVQAWWSKDLARWSGPVETDAKRVTFNVGVAAVPNPPPGLPPHRYVMIDENDGIHVSNGTGGNLTAGWAPLSRWVPGAKGPGQRGCPSIRFSPKDQFYYTISGGRTVDVARTRDFRSWELAARDPWAQPDPADAQVAPLLGFPGMAANRCTWDHTSNDVDMCCAHPEANASWFVWGASTQGGQPPRGLPTTCTNMVAQADLPLFELLPLFFSGSSGRAADAAAAPPSAAGCVADPVPDTWWDHTKCAPNNSSRSGGCCETEWSLESAEACCAECQGSAFGFECVAWEYVQSNQTCYMCSAEVLTHRGRLAGHATGCLKGLCNGTRAFAI